MFDIRNLQHVTNDEITSVFNKAFSDYLVRLHYTKEMMDLKIKGENIQLDWSFGAFVKNELIGFVLIGSRNLQSTILLYNAGTGVIPEFRGLNIAEQIYRVLIEKLDHLGAVKHILEVAVRNEKAIQIYHKIGFKISRELICFKGKPCKRKHSGLKINRQNSLNYEEVKIFQNFFPSWQNDFHSIDRLKNTMNFLTVRKDDSILAYCIFNQISGKIFQLAVKPNWRNKGIATELLTNVYESCESKEIHITNVDCRDTESIRFLISNGIKPWLNQYEMEFSNLS